jgi:hypothetical protein
VNEALASGLPCVVSSACGCAEDMVPPTEETRTYPTGNVEKLASVLQSVHKGPRLPGNAGDILSHHDFRVTVDTVSRLYLSTQPPPGWRSSSGVSGISQARS